MEDYIEEALGSAAGFFFVEKKDFGLRPCIDYHGLNGITVKLPVPISASARSTQATQRGTHIYKTQPTQHLQDLNKRGG